ncbi:MULTISPECIES: hypothetical protein [Bacillus]|uniref:hypothetical protein n=2 Tax=Bacillaceae TaxID=186817 RepID=UPI000871E749|nr:MULTISPECIES: hypothetical protein [Bacillus]MCC0760830.1 hypothetical protein [Bacillus sp. BRTN]MCC0771826.1 hypothetical protein [Bacillus pacificus]MDA1854848.1 hypothetical protein [Bacillus cereus]MDG1569562.1 hypothetical protein [Bacillus cereus]OFE37549.1 hypothetical protein BGV83_06955 [Bacillus anthracis]
MDNWKQLYETVIKKRNDFTIYFGLILILLSFLYAHGLINLSVASFFGFSLSGIAMVYLDMVEFAKKVASSIWLRRIFELLEVFLYLVFMSGILIIPNLKLLQSGRLETYLTENSNAFTILALAFTILLMGLKSQYEGNNLYKKLLSKHSE